LPRAIACVLPEFFTQVARKFRGLSGMAYVDNSKMWQIYRSALSLVMFEHLIQKDLLRPLTSSYGVVIDGAYWAKTASDAHDKAIHTVGDFSLWIPPRRYSLPQAQVQLFRLGYGFHPNPPTGEGFEFTLAHFLEATLLAANGLASLHQLLVKLGFKEGSRPGWDNILHYGGVCVCDIV